MKKHLFYLILMVSIFSISAEVKNPDKPLKGDWDFKPVKTWEITNAGNEVMGRIRQFRVNEAGMVYVNDRNKINHIFDKNGAFLGSFAKKGEGPGEKTGTVKKFWPGYLFENGGQVFYANNISERGIKNSTLCSSPKAFKICPQDTPLFGIWDMEFPGQAGSLLGFGSF